MVDMKKLFSKTVPVPCVILLFISAKIPCGLNQQREAIIHLVTSLATVRMSTILKALYVVGTIKFVSLEVELGLMLLINMQLHCGPAIPLE